MIFNKQIKNGNKAVWQQPISCHRILQDKNQIEEFVYRIFIDLQYAMFFHKNSGFVQDMNDAF